MRFTGKYDLKFSGFEKTVHFRAVTKDEIAAFIRNSTTREADEERILFQSHAGALANKTDQIPFVLLVDLPDLTFFA